MGMKRVWETVKRYKFILLVLVAGVIVLLLPTGGSKNETPPAESGDERFSLKDEEARIAEAISSIEGAGRAEVVLTLKTGWETVLATDWETETESEEGAGQSEKKSAAAVTVSAGSGHDEAVPLKRLYPVYQGALVVCEGAGDAGVRFEVQSAVASLTGLSSDRIAVSKMKEDKQ